MAAMQTALAGPVIPPLTNPYTTGVPLGETSSSGLTPQVYGDVWEANNE
jgi:hypothetical protein